VNTPSEFTELAPGLEPHPSDTLVTRATWDAFAGTDLHAQLRAKGVTQLVIAGLATSFGVESTARRAYDLGYHVVLAVDAMSDMRAEARENSPARIFPLIGQTATTAKIVTLLSTD
jgi:nicotinamidase-related amidase